MRKARYFIRCTVDSENKKTEVHDGTGRYATLREAREALNRLTLAPHGTDMKYRFNKDKKKLYRYYEGDSTYFTHTILPIKLLQK